VIDEITFQLHQLSWWWDAHKQSWWLYQWLVDYQLLAGILIGYGLGYYTEPLLDRIDLARDRRDFRKRFRSRIAARTANAGNKNADAGAERDADVSDECVRHRMSPPWS
jgi:hypothetical protein